jgi:hypothetical protein
MKIFGMAKNCATLGHVNDIEITVSFVRMNITKTRQTF